MFKLPILIHEVICPECGHKNKKKEIEFGFKCDNGEHGFFGKCEKCKAKWETKY